MVRLSVNVNKVATLRNARGGAVPSVVDAVRVCIGAGATGITVHPRADERHITRRDVLAIASFLGPRRREIEFNIEGDPRPDLLALVRELAPHQCTLVPVRPGEVTSQAGWPPDTQTAELGAIVRDLQDRGIRVSLFIEPEDAAVKWAAAAGAARIELYTEPFAHAFKAGEDAADRSFRRYVEAANLAHALG
jgi:pyridoxine 5-phosphate synthase